MRINCEKSWKRPRIMCKKNLEIIVILCFVSRILQFYAIFTNAEDNKRSKITMAPPTIDSSQPEKSKMVDCTTQTSDEVRMVWNTHIYFANPQC